MSVDFAAARAVSLIETVGRYVQLKKAGSEYVGLCPFHNDKGPSFTLYRGAGGTWRYRCFPCGAGSEGGDVIDFVLAIETFDAKLNDKQRIAEAVRRLTGGELPQPGERAPRHIEEAPSEEDCWHPIVPAPADAPEYDPAMTYNPSRTQERKMVSYRPERVDTYRDAEGRVLLHVPRLRFGDGKKYTPAVTYCEGPEGRRLWCVKTPPEPYPLQGLDELAQRPTATVLVVSGEKCRAAAAEHLGPAGFVAVTWLGGDNRVDKADVTPLRGRSITFWPDADDSGRRAMALLAKRIDES